MSDCALLIIAASGLVLANCCTNLHGASTNRDEAPALAPIVVTGAPPVMHISTNQAEWLIPKWLQFCKRLDLDPGGKTNIADIDWEATFCGESPYGKHPGTLYSVRFKNEVIFQAINDMIIVHANMRSNQAAPDRPAGYMATNNWRELARGFEALLEKTGVPREYLNTLKAVHEHNTIGMDPARCFVSWYDPVEHEERIRRSPVKHVDYIDYALSVTFDMQTGRLVHVFIHDLRLAEWQQAKKGAGP